VLGAGADCCAEAVAAKKHSVPATTGPAKMPFVIYFLPDAEAWVSFPA
jgi:hypothetical protein